VYEARTVGGGRDILKLTPLENAVADQGTSIDRLETAVGTMRQGLGLPATGSRRKRGGASKGVTMAEGVDTIDTFIHTHPDGQATVRTGHDAIR
jgi:hypothetical protein